LFRQTEPLLWALVKPGGYLVIVVPEETLYEQHFFPSIVNDDHKSTFRFQTHDTWSSRSFDIYELCKRLPDSSIISAMIQDHGYDRRYIYSKGKPALKKMPRIYKLGISLIKRMPVIGKNLEIRFRINLINKGIPFDQTKFGALAQIEIIVKKVVKV